MLDLILDTWVVMAAGVAFMLAAAVASFIIQVIRIVIDRREK